MAKSATKTPAKPAPKPAQRAAPARAGARPNASGGHRDPDPEPERRASVPAAPRQSTAVAAPSENLPAHMQSDAGMGKEGIGQGDMDMPRLKLMQGLSKELTLYDDLRAGNFFHTATETIFDDEFIRVVPIYLDRQFILWRPLESGGGILARAPDGVHWQPSKGEFKVKLDKKDGGHEVTWKLAPTVQESGLANWGTHYPGDNNSPPAATLMYNFLLAFPDYPDLMPAVLTFQRSSIKHGRKFMTKLKTVRTPLFGSVFRLQSTEDHNSANQNYFNMSMTGDGVVQDKAMYDYYKDMHLSLTKSGLNIRDVDSLQDEPDTGGKGGDDGQPAGNY